MGFRARILLASGLAPPRAHPKHPPINSRFSNFIPAAHADSLSIVEYYLTDGVG
jgi:hypothetical protein